MERTEIKLGKAEEERKERELGDEKYEKDG